MSDDIGSGPAGHRPAKDEISRAERLLCDLANLLLGTTANYGTSVKIFERLGHIERALHSAGREVTDAYDRLELASSMEAA